MFCPNCRYEYRAGVAECPDCGAALVVELPSKPGNAFVADESKFIVAFNTFDGASLAIAKSILDDAGVYFFVDHEHNWAYNRPMQIRVDISNLSRVQELLKDLK